MGTTNDSESRSVHKRPDRPGPFRERWDLLDDRRVSIESDDRRDRADYLKRPDLDP
jgi:hypothetical protein